MTLPFCFFTAFLMLLLTVADKINNGIGFVFSALQRKREVVVERLSST